MWLIWGEISGILLVFFRDGAGHKYDDLGKESMRDGVGAMEVFRFKLNFSSPGTGVEKKSDRSPPHNVHPPGKWEC